MAELLLVLQKCHADLAGELEVLTSSLSSRSFAPSLAEQLYAGVVVFLRRCFDLVHNAAHPMQLAVPERIRMELQRFCTGVFGEGDKNAAVDAGESLSSADVSVCSVLSALVSSNADVPYMRNRGADTPVQQCSHASNRLAIEFQRDLQPSKMEFRTKILPCGQRVRCARQLVSNHRLPTTVGALVALLTTWRSRLRCHIARAPSTVDLRSCSHSLSRLRSTQLQIPGQYLSSDVDGSCNPIGRNLLRVYRMDCRVKIQQQNGLPQRKIAMITKDGQRVDFLLQFHTQGTNRGDTRMSRLNCFLNVLMRSHAPTAGRNIQFNEPTLVPLGCRLRLKKTTAASRCLREMASQHYSNSGTQAQAYWLQFLNTRQANTARGDTAKQRGMDSSASKFHGNVVAFQRICGSKRGERSQPQAGDEFFSAAEAGNPPPSAEMDVEAVPMTILTDVVNSAVPSASDLFAFKESFVRSLSAVCYTSYALCMDGLPLEALRVDFTTGALVAEDRQPVLLRGSGYVAREAADTMPFRLTRNIQRFLGPFRLSGSLVTYMASISSCLAEDATKECLRFFLQLFFRDTLQSCPKLLSSSSAGVRGKSGVGGGSIAKRKAVLEAAVQHNVSDVLEVVQRLAIDPTACCNPGRYFQSRKRKGLATTGHERPAAKAATSSRHMSSGLAHGASQPVAGSRPRWGAELDMQQPEQANFVPELDQHVIDLIAIATDPNEQAQIPVHHDPWF